MVCGSTWSLHSLQRTGARKLREGSTCFDAGTTRRTRPESEVPCSPILAKSEVVVPKVISPAIEADFPRCIAVEVAN